MSQRIGRVQRRTTETEIEVELGLEGSGQLQIDTGIGFFDHMLAALSRHGLFDLKLKCRGDLQVDAHHTVEDTGVCLGQALALALGDKAGIQRFGHSYVPMDEALARAVVDLSGRPYLVLQAAFHGPQVGGLPVGLVREFMRALADQARMNLHLDLLRGSDDHHGIEALFKACGRALAQAVALRPGEQGVPSTKGVL